MQGRKNLSAARRSWHIVLRSLVLSLAIAANAARVGGQSLPAGTRVRLTLTDSSSYAGALDSTRDGRIWVGPGATPHSVDRERVIRMDLSRGRKPNWLLGAALGAGAGLVTGLVMKNAIEPNIESGDASVISAAYLGAGALGGALIGTGLSIVLAPERWEPVPPDRWTAPPEARRNLRSNPRWQLSVKLSR